VSKTKQVAPVKKNNSQIKQKYSAGDSAPDYVIKKDEVAIGYMEAKDIGADLNKIEKSDQIQRYLKSLDNLVLTDYLEFRFLVR